MKQTTNVLLVLLLIISFQFVTYSQPPVTERRTAPPPVTERRTAPPPVTERRTAPPPLIVRIGSQTWMKENLNVDRFRNGDPIPEARTVEEWQRYGDERKACWCYFNDDPAKRRIYGKLYNWYAVNDWRMLPPAGWHVPTDAEWTTLITFLGGEAVAGGKMKAVSPLWRSPNTGATNSSEFAGFPGGDRSSDGITIHAEGNFGYWWSATEGSGINAWGRGLHYGDSSAFRGYTRKTYGFSVRCIKD